MEKVSVVLPCYNHGKYVADAIKSVLNQTYTNLELFVFDNGSTDHSWDVIQEFDDPRMKKIRLKENNLLEVKKQFIKMGTGRYFAIMYSDDVWKEKKLEKQMELFKNNKKARVCFTWSKIVEIDEELNEIEETEEFWKDPNQTPKEWWNTFFTRSNHLSCPSFICEREIYEKYFGKLYPFRQIADFFCWMKILEETNLYTVEDVLVIQRRHNSGANKNESYRSPENISRELVELKYIIYKIIDEMPDKIFLENFCDLDMGKEEIKHMDVMCKKFLFFVKRNRGFISEYDNAIRYYNTYFEYEENGVIFYQFLKNKYGFSREDFFMYEWGEKNIIEVLESRVSRWARLENTDFSTVIYPDSISIYGCGQVGKIFSKKIRPYCRVKQFIDTQPRQDKYDNISVVSVENAIINEETVIVVIPTYDFERIVENIKKYHGQIMNKNIIRFEDFLKTGRMLDAEF